MTITDKLDALPSSLIVSENGLETVDSLVRWLNAKYERHRELEDQAAAQMLQCLAARLRLCAEVMDGIIGPDYRCDNYPDCDVCGPHTSQADARALLARLKQEGLA